MEWQREDEKLAGAQRDQAVDQLIGLVGAVDGICQMQAKQYITTGVQDPRFLAILGPMIDAAQGARINAALAPIVGGSMN